MGDVSGARAVAEWFDNRRQSGEEFGWPPDGLALDTIEQGYAAQDALLETICGRGDRIGGWKIALTTPVMQEMVGVDHPCEGAIVQSRVFQSPGEVSVADFVNIGVESEIAVRIGSDIRPGSLTADRSGASEAIDACMAAIEIVDDRKADYQRITGPVLLADNAMNAGCVLGAPVLDWHDLDLAALQGRMEINGETVGDGTGSDVLGHPLDAVAWLLASLSARGRSLSKGDIVMTGSIGRTHWLKAGDVMATEIDGLGRAELAVR